MDEKFDTWEELRKGFNFTPDEEKEIEKEKQKILAKIQKHKKIQYKRTSILGYVSEKINLIKK